MARETKAELEAKIATLQEDIEFLEEDRDLFLIHRDKFFFVKCLIVGGFGLVVVSQIVFAALDKPGPFGGPFGWILVGLAALYLLGFLAHSAMLLKQRIRLNAELSSKKAQLQAVVEQEGESKPAESSPAADPARDIGSGS